MKLLAIFSALFLLSCSNNSTQVKIYNDSAIYFSNKLAALTDSGFSSNDSIRMKQQTRLLIYQTMRQHYIDLSNLLKK